MTGAQVEMYFNQAQKLLGRRVYLFVNPPGKTRRWDLNKKGQTVTKFEPGHFKTNEAYEKMLKRFGGRIKHG